MNKGSSQGSRKNKALSANYIELDERSMLDMVQFTLDFSQNVNFYGLQNKVIDNWRSFLLNDSAFVIALIATTNTNKFTINIEDLELQKDSRIKLEIAKQTNKIIDLITDWFNRLKHSNYNGSLLREIEKQKLYADYARKILKENDPEIERLKEVYNTIYGNLVFIIEKASKNFEEEIVSSHNHHPHIGLLLAFFRLFKNVQQDVNLLTKKHLDFYYLKLLHHKKRKRDPGSAIVELQLQQGTEELVINEGEKCEFIFEGNQKHNFITSSVAQINNAEIAEIRTLYKSDYHPFRNSFNDDDFSLNVLYEEDILVGGNSSVNTGILEYADFPSTFGEVQVHKDFSEAKKRLSDIGIIVSSPALILEKGKQKIKLTFKITPDSFRKTEIKFKGLVDQEVNENEKSGNKQNSQDKDKIKKRVITDFFKEAFAIYITDKEGWKEIKLFNTKFSLVETTLTFDFELNEQADKLISMDSNIHEGGFKSEWPCIKLQLSNVTQYHPYKILRNIILEYVIVEADVSEVNNLTLSNPSGNLDNSIPFMPFGPAPVVGSYLKIQNPLILQRNLTDLKFTINWAGLPQVKYGFEDYYKAYPNEIGNNSFKAYITQNRNIGKISEKQGKHEFGLFKTKNEYLNNSLLVEINLDHFDFSNLIDQKMLNSEESANPIFMVLANPEIAFGHQVFTNIYAEAALNSSRFKRSQTALPNQPFTPVIEHLTVEYSNAAKEIMLRKQDDKGSDIKLVHLYPFGYVQAFPGPIKSQSYLFPQIEKKGNLFIGLTQIKSSDIVSIGFELIHAVYIHTAIKAPEIQWEYLSNNDWIPLDGFLLEDTTGGLIKSGVVKIEIPNSIQFDNTRLSPGKFWIRAAYRGKENLNSRIKNVFTQAVSLISDQSTSEQQQAFKPDQKIKNISFSGLNGIGKITGPYALDVNNLFEDEESFYNRVSEQLRHKNRVVSNWDVERIILDKFKNIEKVRVYGRNTHPRELVKGSNMQIVLIPKNNMGNGAGRHNNKVDFHTLNEIKEYVSQRVSPYTKVEASNPVYELLKVRCKIQFNDYQKRGSLRNVLNNELISYLSPDIENSFIEKGFDESISKTEILNFIESRPYVEFATQLSVLQLIEVQGRYRIIDTAEKGDKKTEELRTISPYAILTSAPEHQIEVIKDRMSLSPEISGVGDLSIESDFVISDENGQYN